MKKKLNKRVPVLGLLLAVVLSGLLGTRLLASQSEVGGNDYVPGEILVKFKPGTPASVVAHVHRENKGVVKEEIAGIGVQVVKLQEGSVASRTTAYNRNPNVEYAEPNYIAQALGDPSDEYFIRQWGLDNDGQVYKDDQSGMVDADIDAPEAWDITRGSSGVKIAILDSGIDQDHEDLSSKIIDQKDFTDSGTVDDLYGHGTHVGGIAAAVTGNTTGVAGVGHDSSLMNGKVLGDSGSGAYSWVANGITWATDNDAEVINMSLGGSRKSSALEDAVNYAWGKGVVLVAAAGNSGNPSPTYPAKYGNCIAVAATDDDDQKASWSSYGNWVDVAAPGVEIFSTFPNHPYAIGKSLGYDYGSGTSMSTPHVAGVAALVWATGFGTNNQAVRDQIEQTADPIPGTGDYWIWGRVNACNAVGGTCLYEGGGTEPTPTPTPEPTPTPTPEECLPCFKGVCDGHCHPVKEDADCPDCW